MVIMDDGFGGRPAPPKFDFQTDVENQIIYGEIGFGYVEPEELQRQKEFDLFLRSEIGFSYVEPEELQRQEKEREAKQIIEQSGYLQNSQLPENSDLLRNATKALAEAIRHFCETGERVEMQDSNLQVLLGRYIKEKEQQEFQRQKDAIDKMSAHEISQKYSFVKQLNPYQGIDATNVHLRRYVISRYYEQLQNEAPKSPSLQNDPSYRYHQQLAQSGVDPATGEKASPAQIAHSQAVMASMVLSPFAQSLSLAYNYPIHKKDTKPTDEAPKYTPPSGGGGVTNTFVKNDKTITMGHGGRRQEIMNKLGLNYLEVEEAIANHVSTQNLNIGNNAHQYIEVNGTTIQYRPFVLPDGTINVGTYFVPGTKK